VTAALHLSDDATAPVRRSRAERQAIVLDTAERLFASRSSRSVGMDELVRETGLGKATVYRLYPSKDTLVAAYLDRLARQILTEIDAQSASLPAADALRAVLSAVHADIRRPEFRGCAFNNASIEYDDPQHPARTAARGYRTALHNRLRTLAGQLLPDDRERARALGSQLAVLIDGAYTNAAHLGPQGPAADGLDLARHLVEQAEQSRRRR
jgi:AcrR family transcriptional regulator